MTNTECREAFAAVTNALNESGLGWVVTQVLEQIRLHPNSLAPVLRQCPSR